MSFIAAAAITVGGSLIGGMLQSNAQSNAAQLQSQAALFSFFSMPVQKCRVVNRSTKIGEPFRRKDCRFLCS